MRTRRKGKAVHSAIATGCLSCHEVRVNKDITRIKLITSTPQALCLTCHADKDAATLKGTVHPPAVRDCIKCHDPHTSDNKNQLLKPESGDKGQNLCLDLPQPRTERPGKRQPPRRARHGMRHLPHHSQDRRSRQAGVRFSPDQEPLRRSASIATTSRTRACRRRITTSPSPPRTAPVATIRTSRLLRS